MNILLGDILLIFILYSVSKLSSNDHLLSWFPGKQGIYFFGINFLWWQGGWGGVGNTGRKFG